MTTIIMQEIGSGVVEKACQEGRGHRGGGEGGAHVEVELDGREEGQKSSAAGKLYRGERMHVS